MDIFLHTIEYYAGMEMVFLETAIGRPNEV